MSKESDALLKRVKLNGLPIRIERQEVFGSLLSLLQGNVLGMNIEGMPSNRVILGALRKSLDIYGKEGRKIYEKKVRNGSHELFVYCQRRKI